MVARPVELRVGGQNYRVVSSASSEELERLAAAVDEKLATIVPPGRPLTPQTMLLVAMALAHDVEAERRRAEVIRGRSRAALGELLGEVDATLGLADRVLADRALADRSLAAGSTALAAGTRSGAEVGAPDAE